MIASTGLRGWRRRILDVQVNWPRQQQKRSCLHHPTIAMRLLVQNNKPTSRRLQQISGRSFSTRGDDKSWKNIHALPFTVSPDQAIQKFNEWAIQEQGLNYLIQWDSIRIGASYCPVWMFDTNIRFVRNDVPKSERYKWKPDMFSVYGENQSVIHVPGLAAYAGYSFRRSLIHPVHSTTLVFMRDELVPFGRWMLRDMQVNGVPLEVVPDAWNATRGRAFAVVREDLQAIAQASLVVDGDYTKDDDVLQVQTQVTSSRRVYMPTFYIDYKVFGVEYRAFVSGCDAAAAVSGVSHKVVNMSDDNMRQATNTVLSGAYAGARVVSRNRQLLGTAIVFLQYLASLVARVLVRVPAIGVLGGLFVGFRKIIQPWMDNTSATAEWERQREHEAIMDDQEPAHTEDFTDNGSAERFYRTHRQQILQSLSGDSRHDRGDFDWYADWEQWARKQWEQQQREQEAYGSQQRQQHQRTKYKQKQKADYQWDFDPNDPYSVLGIRRGVTSQEVSAAFRKQMMIYHPDRIGPGTSQAERERATERSKLISEAYRKIKAEMKR